MKTMKFAKELLELKVDLSKVNWTVMRVWVAQRLTELLGLEDEVLIGYVLEQLEGQKVRAAFLSMLPQILIMPCSAHCLRLS